MTVETYTEKRFFEWHPDDTSVSIRARSGSYGGGSEVFVIQTLSAPYAPETTKVSETNMLTKGK